VQIFSTMKSYWSQSVSRWNIHGWKVENIGMWSVMGIRRRSMKILYMTLKCDLENRYKTSEPYKIMILTRVHLQFLAGLCCSIFSFYVVFCRSLFVLFLLAIALSVSLWFTSFWLPFVILEPFLRQISIHVH